MIKIEKLFKNYKKVQALKGISLHVKKGELFAFLGPNGAGKTTTIRILTNLAKLSTGDAWLNGFHIQKDAMMAKRQYGLVPQAVNLDAELTVFENLDIHGRLFGMSKKQRIAKIDELLEYIDLYDRKHTITKQLSGGMKRRITIARALIHSPGILFLDEPTVGLDAKIRRRIWTLVKKIQQAGTTIFLTTHYIEEAEFLAQRVTFLDRGKVVASDTPENLMEKIGIWAIDRIDDNMMKTEYFKSRESAKQYIAGQEAGFTMRRVNLEDAFLSLTGKKVDL